MAKKRTLRKPRTRAPSDGLKETDEAFCQAYVMNGNNGADAVATAMPHTRKWTPQSRAEKASKLVATAKVQARIGELTDLAKQKANEDFCASAEELLYRLTLIGRASIADYIKLDKSGQPTIAFADATPAQMYALNECSVDDKRGRGKRTKIKLADRIAALKMLGQHHGMFKNNMTLKGGTPIPVVLSQAEQLL